MLLLATKQHRELIVRAHAINPVVTIGKIGLSSSVIQEIDQGLSSHELIKIKVMAHARETRETLLKEVCQQLHAASVKHIGKMLVIYRPKSNGIEKSSVSLTGKKKRGPRKTKRSYQN